jgi:hypothetical protein
LRRQIAVDFYRHFAGEKEEKLLINLKSEAAAKTTEKLERQT